MQYSVSGGIKYQMSKNYSTGTFDFMICNTCHVGLVCMYIWGIQNIIMTTDASAQGLHRAIICHNGVKFLV